jgi:hypothetical protein
VIKESTEGEPVSGADNGYDLTPPLAASLAESLRAFRYELPTALADLIDNSITAGSRHFWIDFYWDGETSIIAVTDDGSGMTEDVLRAAMRAGSQNPLQHRGPRDLGRFGLGLKTASFSQCRRLTVRSRTGNASEATRCWDLDHISDVNDWQLLRAANAAAEKHFDRLSQLGRGTTVLWQKLDRLVGGNHAANPAHQRDFLDRADEVRRHLAVVFHQLMSGPGRVELLLNDRPIEPWNPFLEDEIATQQRASTTLTIRGVPIRVTPFILPHQTKISKTSYEAAAGPRGWNAHQGFYVYRNKRLLVAGDWLGLGWAKEEHYKLARIRVEFSNSIDAEWAIDVTKSRATPPSELRAEFRRIGERARADAKSVYTHRGANLTPQGDADRVLLWEPVAKHDKVFYRLNRAHPLHQRALAATTDRPALNALLRLIEETVPFPHITISNSDRPGSLPGPFDHAAESQIREVMQEAFRSLVDSGYGRKEAVDRLRTLWPFELFPAILEALAEAPPNA